MKYRVFVTRYYTAVNFFDIECETARQAASLATRAARQLRPDPRLEATDNGWIPDEPITIKRIGQHGRPLRVAPVVEVKLKRQPRGTAIFRHAPKSLAP